MHVRDLTVSAQHGQIFIFSPEVHRLDTEQEGFIEALNDALDSCRFVGTAFGLVDLVTPGHWNWETPMRVEVWAAEPEDDAGDWDHEVDLDFDAPDGCVFFEAAGGGLHYETDIPAGSYRLRVSGRGFTGVGLDAVDGDDSYRLRLWPRAQDREPVLRKNWPGWRDFT